MRLCFFIELLCGGFELRLEKDLGAVCDCEIE